MVKLELYSVKENRVQLQGGINWGFSEGHVCVADAYIALTKRFFENNDGFFPEQGSVITVEWDDGTIMECLLEGTQEIGGMIFPKQISTSGDKSTLGLYLRRRLGVLNTHRISMDDLNTYGRNDIDIRYISGLRYFFDFSV